MLDLVPGSGFGPIDGLGFSVRAERTPLGRAWVQTGRIRGFAAYAAHWPDERLTVVALTNTDQAALARLVAQVAEELAGA